MTSRNIVRRACRRMMDKQDRGIGRLQRGWLKRMRGSEWASDAPATSALADAGHRGARFPAIYGAVLGIVAALLALTVGAALVRADTLAGTVQHVVDGDTFAAGLAGQPGVRVRISDIDAPELHGRCITEIEMAERARDRLRALIGGRRVLLVIHARDHDRYGRLLAEVWVDGIPVGPQLVKEGLARPWTGRRMPWC